MVGSTFKQPRDRASALVLDAKRVKSLISESEKSDQETWHEGRMLMRYKQFHEKSDNKQTVSTKMKFYEEKIRPLLEEYWTTGSLPEDVEDELLDKAIEVMEKLARRERRVERTK